MSSLKIDKDDKNRVLLTELLPYEVPMLFSNEGFYSIVSSNKYMHFFDKIESLKKSKNYVIPFNYEVRKSVEGDTRTLSVIHPLNQYNFIDFYQKYDSLILHLCSKCPFSLRRVSKVAKFYYSPDLVFEEDESRNEEVEVEPDILDKETKFLKSYFTYHPIDLIYKFYERYEYQRLEQRFNYLMEFDINKCFYNIYTHSISWAVKDKESAKRNASKNSFENEFDKIMRHANYNETNGIVVGPEVSRIFAEIILQQIDINVLNELENCKVENNKLKLGVDYEIRRYVDDYFIFSNDKNILNLILKTYKRKLEEYKLYINISKTQTKTTPFITNIAVGKRELKHLLDSLFNRLIISEDKTLEDGKVEKIKCIKILPSPYKESIIFIKDFQCIVKRNDLSYDLLSKDIIRRLKSFVVIIFKDTKLEKERNNIENFLLMLLDIAFYAYSLNITSSTTFKLAQMIVLICKFLEQKDEDLKHSIFSKISREVDFVMTIFQRKTKLNETNVETLNLLIALKKLDSSYLISEKKIRELFRLKNNKDFVKLNYFHIITLLYYIDNNTNYELLKNEIETSVIKKYTEDDDPFTKSELTLLFFDFICCPFVTKKSKKAVIRESGYSKENYDKIIEEIEKQNTWFMDWNTEIDLERVLKKKEWRSSY